MSQHIGPRTVSGTGGSIKRVGNYKIHSFPADFVEEGLKLHVDFGNPNCFSGESSDTSVRDLSGNGYVGTITGGPVWNTVNGGALTFDGTDDLVQFGSLGSFTGYTIEILVESGNVINYRNILDANYGVHNVNSGPRFEQNGSGGASSGNLKVYTSQGTGASYQSVEIKSSNGFPPLAKHVALTYNPETDEFGSFYEGAQEFVSPRTVGGKTMPFNNFTLGSGFDGSRDFQGRVYVCRVYDRALSPQEIAQNYDSLKVRYSTYTNNFTPITTGLNGPVEVLAVGGGGGGGSYAAGGGGGAGGLYYNSALSLDNNTQVAIGIGGYGRGGYSQQTSGDAGGANGGNTTFGANITCHGGGAGGAGWMQDAGNNGGSGGGGSGSDGINSQGINANGGSATVASQGNAGGAGRRISQNFGAAGGGGGAGAAGEPAKTNSASLYGGHGGEGLAYNISGETKYYAAGGNGTAYGSIGDKKSSTNGIGGRSGAPGKTGIHGTGSGGGGSRGTSGVSLAGGDGGHGKVIVRYPAADYNVEVLVVGAGGGGGYDTGGGGGAGGLVYNSKYAVSSGENIQVTVGKGGSAAINSTSYGENGGNSKFHSIVCIGGGAGGSNGGGKQPGLSGGSGGGGGAYSAVQGSGGSGVPGQGNDGGTAVSSAGGGGGGAGLTGFDGDGTVNGDNASDGGDGLSYSITGSSVVYAAGGGGGQNASTNRGVGGSSGVGGTGGTSSRNPTDPSAGTGSGGGGGANTNQPNGVREGTNGADGVVIIAYKGPQRGTGGTIDTTSRPGYTLHKFTTSGLHIFIP